MVVVPRGFDLRSVPGMVEENREWIESAVAEVERRRQIQGSPDAQPDSIELRALNEVRRLEWIRLSTRAVRVADDGLHLTIAGPIDDRTAWRDALRRWLVDIGKQALIPALEAAAKELGVRVERVSIRCQRTRWGSYTSKPGSHGSVSLNAQLLFLPEELVRYVMVHELCHAEHPNHSPAFWASVAWHVPDVEACRKQLRGAWQYVPAWIAA